LDSDEAIELADHSISHHMRLLSGFTTHWRITYARTNSPSEPMLVVGSVKHLYSHPGHHNLRLALATLAYDLCSAGLVDKGVLGELAARTLLLIARDLASTQDLSSTQEHWEYILKPLPLSQLLKKLLGHEEWMGSNNGDREKFTKAFQNAYVNFTHWMVTKDHMPEELDPCVEGRLVSYFNY
jgi:hypothetical protein